MAKVSEISKEIKLDIGGLPSNLKQAIKTEVGEFVTDEILRSVSKGTSPVAGRGRFKILNNEYAKDEKGGNRSPNLELDGDMLDALTFKNTSSNSNSIKVGIFSGKQVPKADGHNDFSGDSKLPTRRFIPNDKDREIFDKRIEDGIDRIVEEHKGRLPQSEQSVTVLGRPRTSERISESTEVRVGDLIEGNSFDALLAEYLNGQ